MSGTGVMMRVAVIVGVLGLALAGEAGAGEGVTLVFLATTDVHGHVEGEGVELTLVGGEKVRVERGGLELFSGYVKNAREAHPDHVVLVDGGDMLQGTLMSNLGEGRAVVRAMNVIGYAASAVGNHEFDFGPVGARSTPRPGARRGDPEGDPLGALKQRAREAKQPWLTANLTDDKGLPPGAPWVRTHTVITVGGIKVGIVGGTAEDLLRTTIRPNVAGVHVGSLEGGIVRAAAAARGEGATVVVAVVHAGGDCKRVDSPMDPSSCEQDADLWKLARALPPGTVDAIFGGHTHQGVAHVIHGVPLLQAYANARSFSRLDLRVDRATGRAIPGPGGFVIHPPTEICGAVTDEVRSCSPERARGRRVIPAEYEGRPVLLDENVRAAVAEDVARVATRQAAPVGVVLASPLTRSYRAESALGNFAADVLRDAVPGADVGMTNGGGLRADLPSGPLNQGALFAAFPFDNKLAVLKLPGARLRHLLEANVQSDKGILSLAGVHLRARCAAGKLLLDATLSDGKPLRDDAVYTIATTDFLAMGGDELHPVVQGLASTAVRIDDDAPTQRDLLGAAFKRKGPTMRGDDPGLYDPAHPRIELPAARPMRCNGVE